MTHDPDHELPLEPLNWKDPDLSGDNDFIISYLI